MRKILLFALVISSATSIFSQEWTEPVQVSSSEGYHMEPDMCIDNNGIIHVVWSKRITGKFWKIMYSNSSDNGETWSEDYDISQNDTLWMSQPHIAFDSENNLYVTYDYDTYSPSKMLVYLKIFNEGLWSEPILVSEGMLGSDYNKVIVDNENKLMIGWYRSSKFYYRFYENSVFSDVYCPYCDSTDVLLPVEGVLSPDQIIKWVGASASYNYIGERLQYFEYDLFNDSWTKPEMLDTNKLKVGLDISLNSSDHPEVGYRLETSVWPNPFSDATYYMNYDGQQLNPSELIVEDPYDQQIAVDQFNRPHITDREKTSTGQQLVHYQKINDEWIGYIIDSSGNMVNDAKLLYSSDYLYLTYFKSEVPGDLDSDILFTKYDIITGKHDLLERGFNFVIYPNPTVGNVTVEFTIRRESEVIIILYDMNGHLLRKINFGKLLPAQYKKELGFFNLLA